MKDGIKDFIQQLPKQIGLLLAFLIYVILYILQNLIKERFNVDIAPLIQDKRTLGIFILAFFVYMSLIKSNKTDGDWGLLFIFAISLIIVVMTLCFQSDDKNAKQENTTQLSPYERCIDKSYARGRTTTEVERLCGQLSKEVPCGINNLAK